MKQNGLNVMGDERSGKNKNEAIKLSGTVAV